MKRRNSAPKPEKPTEAEPLPPLRKIGTIDKAELSEDDCLLLAKWQVYPVVPLPSDAKWNGIISHLRFALHAKPPAFRDPRLSDQQHLVVTFANLVGSFFMDIPEMKAEGLHQPFVLLVTAFNDLAGGKIPALFKPQRRPPNRPPNLQIDDIIKGKVARALELSVKSASDIKDAARMLAGVLKTSGIRGARQISAATIINWRYRCSEGRGAVSDIALVQFLDPLPREAGETPAEQAAYLIRELQSAPVLRASKSQ